MKNLKKLIVAFFIFAGAFTGSYVKAQTSEPSSPFKVTADLVSSYYWRGVLSSGTPNFQPTFAYDYKNFEIGVWGSTDFIGAYKEADLYASLGAGPLKFTVTDYDWNFGSSNKYFDYKSKTTPHIFEGSVGYSGPAKFPLSITANVMLAGADKKYSDPSKQAYSTYIELDYGFKYVTAFLGVTPADGYYGDGYGGNGGFSVCNLGLTASKSLKISSVYSLPLKATLGFNPQASDIYYVFGITF